MTTTKISKAEFKRLAVSNGVIFLGTTKQPFPELAIWIAEQPRNEGKRDTVTATASGILKRHFERDGKPAQSELRLDKNSTCYQFENGHLAVHNEYPATPGYPAWEQTLVYA